jgi:tripartite-type tricarboxylate transporter receptor subunit TctC
MTARLIGRLFTAALICGATIAHAQEYPNKLIKIVVPFGAGGITDVYARLIAEGLHTSLSQPVIVENRPGQGGSLGPAAAAKAEPDGYTLLLGGTGNTIGETLYKNLSFSMLKDFVPIVRGATIVNVLFIKNALPVKSVQELVALAKSEPGKLQYASSGYGGVYHLAFELFKYMTGTNILHVPYRTEPAARTDVIAGRMDMMITAYGVAAPSIDAGQVRALALTGKTHFSRLPGVPTLAESGLPGYDGDAWIGLLAPTGTPTTIVNKIHAAVTEIQKQPEFQAKLAQIGLSAVDETPEQFATFLTDEVMKWKKIIELSGTTVNQ